MRTNLPMMVLAVQVILLMMTVEVAAVVLEVVVVVVVGITMPVAVGIWIVTVEDVMAITTITVGLKAAVLGVATIDVMIVTRTQTVQF